MIEVRIRLSSDTEAIHLCTWDSSDLDSVIPTIRSWGLSCDHSDAPDDPQITGQIRLTEHHAFFEVTVHEEDEA